MPIKRFWFYNKQVDRLAAERDLRTINLLGSATSSESYGKAVENLQKQMGELYVWKPATNQLVVEDDGKPDPEFDRKGLMSLKARIAPKKISQD